MTDMPDPGAGPFARAIAVSPDGDGRYRGEINPGWDIGGNANGGYLLGDHLCRHRVDDGGRRCEGHDGRCDSEDGPAVDP
jgi:hypothetical protein